ncbi:hypothetical protein SCLCIDRAFT_108468 [Scleroderma citrinum Foug A]|uniref:Uncharacterized protein n=1 Tax=Scleroderma citrinum Foug A TaxID=1036808 RepID=A0A0C3AR26_9AGAM|nr:hypothetical protein SCLCIDRAFT_108468 [Scleroderma citrinum Foug A]
MNEYLDWCHLQDGDLYKTLVVKLKSKTSSSTFELWKKPQNPEGARHAESLAKSALTHSQYWTVNTDIHPSFLIQGQHLLVGSQKSFY